jgi:hypothetical protein
MADKVKECSFCRKERPKLYWGGVCGYCRRKHMGRDIRVPDAVILEAINAAFPCGVLSHEQATRQPDGRNKRMPQL